MKIQKYRTGGPAGALAANPAMGAPYVIPAALIAAFMNTFENPEDTAYARGVRQAQELSRARNSPIPTINVEANRIAENNALTEDWNRKLANGPYTINYTDGSKMIVTDFNNGYLTTKKIKPSGSFMYGTIADPRYYGADPYKADSYIYNPTKGTTRAFYDYTANGVQYFKPGAYPVVTSELNPEFFKVRLLSSSEPIFTEDGVLIDQSALGSPAPNDPKKDPKDDKKSSRWGKLWNKIKANKGVQSGVEIWQNFGNGARTGLRWTTNTLGLGVTTSPLWYGGYHLGKYLGWWGNNQVTEEPVKQEQSEYTYDNANLKEMVKRREEQRLKADSLNNAQ